jgi:hypothetical protein
MKRLVLAALAALAVRAQAQTAPPPAYVFTTVDDVLLEWSNVYVTGVVEGETAARRIVFTFSNTTYASQRQSCERLLLLAMSKPGQYKVRVQQYGTVATCALERVAP